MKNFNQNKEMNNITFFFSLLVCSCIQANVLAQIDVEKYAYTIEVNDVNDRIEVKGSIDLQILKETDYFFLDLQKVGEDGKGMEIISMLLDGQSCMYYHQDERVRFNSKEGFSKGMHTIEFTYSGIPSDGLVIGKNKFGDRTFFGDNWPNRGHLWLLCHDHPSDKALIDFTVTAPDHYTVVSNGELKQLISSEKSTTYYYSSSYVLPIKVSVIGIAKLDSQELTDLDIPVTNFVYPQNAKEGFADMKCASDCIRFFEEYIAPYPFEKLYNVQSTTRFGGMENAGCIFYDEKAITGKGTMESLIAHEIAHQWFGNCATESDWQHLWLSEGFATYFTNLYIENKYGKAQFNEQMRKDREKIIRFARSYEAPVIDTTYKSLMDLLNPNSYQKGSWVLHMLRNTIGDEAFQNAIRAYFQTYSYKNANSGDLLHIMEEHGAVQLTDFFEQWLKTSGHPVLQTQLVQTEGKNELIIKQKQESIFFFPLEIMITSGDKTEKITVDINERLTKVKLNDFSGKINYLLDPEVKILFEAKVD